MMLVHGVYLCTLSHLLGGRQVQSIHELDCQIKHCVFVFTSTKDAFMSACLFAFGRMSQKVIVEFHDPGKPFKFCISCCNYKFFDGLVHNLLNFIIETEL